MVEYINMKKVLGMLLAGGEGSRLAPLTNPRTKPGVPIAGNMRIVDFILTNMIQSDIRHINVFTQYKFDSLNKHINSIWKKNIDNPLMGEYIEVVPAQMRISKKFSEGTAETIYENQHLLDNRLYDHVAVFGADHVYVMNLRDMQKEHLENKADVTICARKMKKKDIPREKDGRLSFGIIDVDLEGRVTGFLEKPEPNKVGNDLWVSMGNYIFKIGQLAFYASNELKDFGKHVLPKMHEDGRNVRIYDFAQNQVPGVKEKREKNYWVDLGTVDSYFETNMMFADIEPKLNLYNREWMLLTPPTKFVHENGMKEKYTNYENALEWDRVGMTVGSLVSEGSIISGAVAFHSILSEHVRMNSYSKAEDSILFEGVTIGRKSKIKNTIIDKNVIVPEGTETGYHKDADRDRGIPISPNGVRTIWKGYDFQFKRGYDPEKYKEEEDFEVTGKLKPLKPTYQEESE